MYSEITDEQYESERNQKKCVRKRLAKVWKEIEYWEDFEDEIKRD